MKGDRKDMIRWLIRDMRPYLDFLRDYDMGKVMSVREWRLRRNQAGVLIGMIYSLPPSKRDEARKIYDLWKDWRISFKEAEERLIKLMGLHKP